MTTIIGYGFSFTTKHRVNEDGDRYYIIIRDNDGYIEFSKALVKEIIRHD